jgi:DNA-directed RNA polymerase subunit RPC12/RpoP
MSAESRSRTHGDLYSIDCPHCGEEICDLWDLGHVDDGMEIECEHCGGKSVVEDREVTITLRGLAKTDASEVDGDSPKTREGGTL